MSTLGDHLLIRADGGAVIGAGHLARCLALAQAWRDDSGGATLVSAGPLGPVESWFRRERIDVLEPTAQPGSAEDAGGLISLAEELQPAVVVVDGYHFNGAYQSRLADAGLRILWIEDEGHVGAHRADWILNQNLQAADSLYERRSGNSVLLLGPRYALLRREFPARRRPWRPQEKGASRLVTTVGGGSAMDLTERFLEAVEQLDRPDLEVRAVVGPYGSRPARTQRSGVELLDTVEDMAALLDWADVALSSAGTTAWELMCLGVPSLLVEAASNQEATGRGLERRGAARFLGRAAEVETATLRRGLRDILDDAEQRLSLAERARKIVDGEGAARVVLHLRGRRLRLRRVRPEDRELIFRWANDAEVRRQSLSPRQITWERHVEWFASRVAPPAPPFWLAVDQEDRPVGQIRFDDAGDGVAEVAMSVAPELRNRGLGSEMLAAGVRALRCNRSWRAIDAHVRPGNEASASLFRKLGFEQRGERTVRGVRVQHFHRVTTSDLRPVEPDR